MYEDSIYIDTSSWHDEGEREQCGLVVRPGDWGPAGSHWNIPLPAVLTAAFKVNSLTMTLLAIEVGAAVGDVGFAVVPKFDLTGLAGRPEAVLKVGRRRYLPLAV